MRISARPLQTVMLSLVILAVMNKGSGQTYQFSIPISGYLTLNVADWNSDGSDGNDGSQNGGYASVNFDTLTETITYDAANNTVEQSGYITLNNPSATTTLNDTRVIDGQTISATVTAQQSVVGGIISFDSGPVPVNSSTLPHFTNPIQLSGSYSLSTGGQIYTGDFSPTLYFPGGIGNTFLPFYDISQVSSTSITLTGNGGEFASNGSGPSSSSDGSGPSYFSNVTATNGFDLSLYSGSAGNFDGNQDFSLTTPDSVTAAVVPEPESMVMFGAGVLALNRLRKRN